MGIEVRLRYNLEVRGMVLVICSESRNGVESTWSVDGGKYG